MFQKAIKTESKLRLAIAGPSGSGKTYSALAIGTVLGEKVAVVDTEHGSASKYADLFDFDVLEMHAPYSPNKYVTAIEAAQEAGYDVLILDSTSHAWNGAGGMLEMVEQVSKKYKGNSYAAWGEITPIYQNMIESIIAADMHVIVTMRSKQDYILVEKNGKQMPQKVGMAPVQRDGFEYEFDVFLDMDIENNAIVQKTRCPDLSGKVFAKPGQNIANILKEWLHGQPAPRKHKPVAEPMREDVADVILKEMDRKYDEFGDVAREAKQTESIFRVDDEIMLHGKNDEKPGTVTAVNGDMVTVLVDGNEYTVKADKLTLVDMVQS